LRISEALRLGLRRGFAVTDSQSFALRNPGRSGNPKQSKLFQSKQYHKGGVEPPQSKGTSHYRAICPALLLPDIITDCTN
jgi:hypothetical protein